MSSRISNAQSYCFPRGLFDLQDWNKNSALSIVLGVALESWTACCSDLLFSYCLEATDDKCANA